MRARLARAAAADGDNGAGPLAARRRCGDTAVVPESWAASTLQRLVPPTVLTAAIWLGASLSGTAESADFSSAEDILAMAEALVEGGETVYVSDYFSFASLAGGQPIAFALDTNRGRTGNDYQAEHFVTFYEGGAGWIEIPGYDRYANEHGALLDLPASPYFTFMGTSYGPVTIASAQQPLTLEVGAITPRFTRNDATVLFSLGSAAATLEWRGRRIPGRVIYEYLVMRGSNRLAGPSLRGIIEALGNAPDFQGLYLTSADGQDFYVQLSVASAGATLMDPLVAFHTQSDRPASMRNLAFEVRDFDPAVGFYRWPAGWRAEWDAECGRASLEVASRSREIERNWLIGGFAMEAVTGSWRCAGREVPVFGFGEVIR